MFWSLSIGSCLVTSCAASRPSCTSWAGVYLFLGAVILVCPVMRVAVARHATMVAAEICRFIPLVDAEFMPSRRPQNSSGNFVELRLRPDIKGIARDRRGCQRHFPEIVFR